MPRARSDGGQAHTMCSVRANGSVKQHTRTDAEEESHARLQRRWTGAGPADDIVVIEEREQSLPRLPGGGGGAIPADDIVVMEERWRSLPRPSEAGGGRIP